MYHLPHTPVVDIQNILTFRFARDYTDQSLLAGAWLVSVVKPSVFCVFHPRTDDYQINVFFIVITEA